MNRLQQILETGNEVFNHVPFPMMLTTKEGTVLWWSREAEKTFGYRAEDVVGKFYPFFDENRSALHKSTWDQVLRSVDPIRFEKFVLESKQGESIHVSILLKALTIDHERFVMFLFEKDDFSTADEITSTQELSSIKSGLDQTFMLTYLDDDGLITYANSLFLKNTMDTKTSCREIFLQLFPEDKVEMSQPIWNN
jgi:PAS domain S-box-containing protein